MKNNDKRLQDLDTLIQTFANMDKHVKESELKNDEKLFWVKQLKNHIIVAETMKKAQL